MATMNASAPPADYVGPPLPPCPILCTMVGNSPCPLSKLDLNIEAHMNVAMVTIHGQWTNLSMNHEDLRLDLPNSQAITICNIRVTAGARGMAHKVYATDIIPVEDVEKIKQSRAQNESGLVRQHKDDGIMNYQPNVFRLPIPQVPPQSDIDIVVTYIETLRFREGRYLIHVPMRFPPGIFSGLLSDVLSVSCSICTGTPNCQWGGSSIPLKTVHELPGYVSLVGNKDLPWPPSDFDISYTIWHNEILTSLVMAPEGSPISSDGRGCFSLFLSPPAPGVLGDPFPRNIIFLVDKSGSMAGNPWLLARNAINYAIETLRSVDQFNIVLFDDRQELFSNGLVQGSNEQKRNAIAWLNQAYTGYTTDIMTPLTGAVTALKEKAAASSNTMELPMVVLLTDGMVSNEREIVNWLKTNAGPVRVSCFGIGPFCNGYFLKMVAQQCRGLCEVCLDEANLQQSMMDMMWSAGTPVLRDVEVVIAGLTSCELYPFPLPDLYCGSPVMVSGKFTGIFPLSVTVRGRTCSGAPVELNAVTTLTETVPLEKLFARQQLDLLTAQAWLTQAPIDRIAVVQQSQAMGVPSPHTTMVCYQADPAKIEKYEGENKQAAKNQAAGKAQYKNDKSSKLALIAVGGLAGVVVLAAAASHFGDLGASMSNLPIASALSGLATTGMNLTAQAADGVRSLYEMSGVSWGGGGWGGSAGGHSHSHTNNDCDCCGDKCCENCCDSLCDGCGECCKGIGNCCEGCGDCVTKCCDAQSAECLGQCCMACCEGLGSMNC